MTRDETIELIEAVEAQIRKLEAEQKAQTEVLHALKSYLWPEKSTEQKPKKKNAAAQEMAAMRIRKQTAAERKAIAMNAVETRWKRWRERKQI